MTQRLCRTADLQSSRLVKAGKAAACLVSPVLSVDDNDYCPRHHRLRGFGRERRSVCGGCWSIAWRERPYLGVVLRLRRDEPDHQRSGHERSSRPAISDAGVADLVGHDLRHFFASALIAAGVDVVAVSKALGHSSAALTLNTYGHLWPKADEKIRAASAGLIASVNSPTDALRTL